MTRMHHFTFTPTPFLGRLQEMNEIGSLLADSSCRLLSLVGPGGIGKTRLALEIISQHTLFPDGIFFVPLASLNRADDMLTAIIEDMPFHCHQDQRSPREQFLGYLHENHAQRV